MAKEEIDGVEKEEEQSKQWLEWGMASCGEEIDTVELSPPM